MPTARSIEDNAFFKIAADKSEAGKVARFQEALKQESPEELSDFLRFLSEQQMQVMTDTVALSNPDAIAAASTLFSQLNTQMNAYESSARAVNKIINEALEAHLKGLEPKAEVTLEQKKDVLKAAFNVAGVITPQLEKLRETLTENKKQIEKVLEENEIVAKIYRFLEGAAALEGMSETPVLKFISARGNELLQNESNLKAIYDAGEALLKQVEDKTRNTLDGLAGNTLSLIEGALSVNLAKNRAIPSSGPATPSV